MEVAAMKSSMKNMVLSLGVVTLSAGARLAGVHVLTEGPIAKASAAKVLDAIKEVVPGFDNNPLDEAWEYVPRQGQKAVTVYPAYLEGRFAGAAVLGYSPNGFAGEIEVMYGFDDTGTIRGFEVLEQEETPGLGAKMNEWFRSEEGSRSVIGRNPQESGMKVTKDGGEIDGITAATISSRAFLEALRLADEAFREYKTAKTGGCDE